MQIDIVKNSFFSLNKWKIVFIASSLCFKKIAENQNEELSCVTTEIRISKPKVSKRKHEMNLQTGYDTFIKPDYNFQVRSTCSSAFQG